MTNLNGRWFLKLLSQLRFCEILCKTIYCTQSSYLFHWNIPITFVSIDSKVYQNILSTEKHENVLHQSTRNKCNNPTSMRNRSTLHSFINSCSPWSDDKSDKCCSAQIVVIDSMWCCVEMCGPPGVYLTLWADTEAQSVLSQTWHLLTIVSNRTKSFI